LHTRAKDFSKSGTTFRHHSQFHQFDEDGCV
jgi:hypothetical protein